MKCFYGSSSSLSTTRTTTRTRKMTTMRNKFSKHFVLLTIIMTIMTMTIMSIDDNNAWNRSVFPSSCFVMGFSISKTTTITTTTTTFKTSLLSKQQQQQSLSFTRLVVLSLLSTSTPSTTTTFASFNDNDNNDNDNDLDTTTFAVASSSSTSSKEEEEQQNSMPETTTTPRRQMTWQELGQNLINLKNAGVPQHVIINTRTCIPNLTRCCVGQSTIPNAGRGVFATMDCQKGDLLTCYPGDVLLPQFSGGTMIGIPPEVQQDDDKLRTLLTRYSIGMTDQYAIMGLPDLDDNPAYLGHLINDGIVHPPTCRDELLKYISESNKRKNAEHTPLEHLHMVTMATKDIKKGEEIFCFYGPVYWMDHKETWIGGDGDE